MRPQIVADGPVITQDHVEAFEAFHGVTLGEDYAEFLLLTNGGTPHPDKVKSTERPSQVYQVNRFRSLPRDAKKQKSSQFIHFQNTGSRNHPLSRHLVVANSDFGLFVMSLTPKHGGSLYYVPAQEEEGEEIEGEEVTLIATSITGFLNQFVGVDTGNGIDLFHEVERKNVAAVRSWLEAGGDPNICDNYENTLIERAAGAGLDEIVEMLLSHGVKVRYAARFAQTQGFDALAQRIVNARRKKKSQ